MTCRVVKNYMDNYFVADNTTELARLNLENILVNGEQAERTVGAWCMKQPGKQMIKETPMNVFELTDPLRCVTSQHCLAAEIETEDYLLGLNPGYVHYSSWSFYKNWLIDGVYDYTYGERGGRFLKQLVRKLAISPTTRHGVINIWEKQLDLSRDFVPCGTQWIFNIVNNQLNMTSIIRSQDACRGFFLDTFAYPFIQQFISDQLGVCCGKYYHVVLNSHIYGDDIEFADRLIRNLSEQHPLMFEDKLTFDMFKIMERISKLIFIKHHFHAAGAESRKLPEFWRKWKSNQVIYGYTKYIKKDPVPTELTCSGVAINVYP